MKITRIHRYDLIIRMKCAGILIPTDKELHRAFQNDKRKISEIQYLRDVRKDKFPELLEGPL